LATSRGLAMCFTVPFAAPSAPSRRRGARPAEVRTESTRLRSPDGTLALDSEPPLFTRTTPGATPRSHPRGTSRRLAASSRAAARAANASARAPPAGIEGGRPAGVALPGDSYSQKGAASP
jgi:hypothetical protein